MFVSSGVGWPVAAVIFSASGKRPVFGAVNEPLSTAANDGVPRAGAVALNEFMSATPESMETPSETTWPANPSRPTGVLAKKFPAYLPLKSDAVGAVRVTDSATPAP